MLSFCLLYSSRYGGGTDQSKFVVQDQITKENVQELEVAEKSGEQLKAVEAEGAALAADLAEINELRRRLKVNRKSLMPTRPKGGSTKRA